MSFSKFINSLNIVLGWIMISFFGDISQSELNFIILATNKDFGEYSGTDAISYIILFSPERFW